MGQDGNKPLRTFSEGTANIIKAMKETGVKRLIVMLEMTPIRFLERSSFHCF
ncbi:hypothetical protein ACFLS7_06750 [Bacteroidota bacterium]